MMIFTRLTNPDLIVIEPQVFSDNRGHFFETYNNNLFSQNGITAQFIQDNLSESATNVLRGLHLQSDPYAQAKLVRVTQGKVIDVAVDARLNSPFYKKYEMVELSAENHKMFFIPHGFLHGFLVLEGPAIFEYKVDANYHKPSERAVLWNDPELAIPWPIKNPILSEKDIVNPPFSSL